MLLSVLLPGSPRIFGLVKYRCQHLGDTASVTEPSREGHADCNNQENTSLHRTQNIVVKGDCEIPLTTENRIIHWGLSD